MLGLGSNRNLHKIYTFTESHFLFYLETMSAVIWNKDEHSMGEFQFMDDRRAELIFSNL